MTDDPGAWTDLSHVEASAILAWADAGKLSAGSAALAVAEKVRRALILTGFDPHIELHIFLTTEEGQALAALREGRGGFSISS